MTNNEISVEQYKVDRLRQNFANRVAAYEDRIATLETQVALVTQNRDRLQEQLDAKNAADGTEVDEEIIDADVVEDAPA